MIWVSNNADSMGDFATMGRSSAIGNATCHRLAAWLFPNHHTHPLQGMGSTSNIIAERMTSPGLIDFWKKLVEGSSVHVAADLLKRLPLDYIYKFQSKNHLKDPGKSWNLPCWRQAPCLRLVWTSSWTWWFWSPTSSTMQSAWGRTCLPSSTSHGFCEGDFCEFCCVPTGKAIPWMGFSTL